MNRLLFLVFLALPCMAGVKIVSDTTAVEISNTTYAQAVLTYKFNQEKIILYGFSFEKIENLKASADTLVMEYKGNDGRKVKKWSKKVPKVKELKNDKR